MNKILSIVLALCLIVPTSGSGSRRVVVKNRNINDIVISQKVIEYDQFSRLQLVVVPVTDLGLQYYYESEPLRGRGLSEADKQELIESIVKGVLEGIERGQNPTPTEPQPTEPTTPTEAGGNHPVPDSELDSKVLTIMNAKCITCHGDKSTNGMVLVSNGRLNKLQDSTHEELRRWHIYDEVYSGRMPKQGDSLSAEDCEVILAWVKSVK